MARKKEQALAVPADDSAIYVKSEYTGINPLVMTIDCLTMTFFGRSKRAYYLVTDIIAWHEKEIRETNGHGGNAKVLETLRTAQSKFEAGKMIVENK